MIFVIDNLKYDTNQMQLISEKCEYGSTCDLFLGPTECYGKHVKLQTSVKGNWLLTYEAGINICAKKLIDTEAENMLLKYDLAKFEELFGKLEEA